MRTILIAFVALAGFFTWIDARASSASLHGPLVQWDRDPSSSARLLWLEKGDGGDDAGGATYRVAWRVETENADGPLERVDCTVIGLPGSSHRIVRADLTGLAADSVIAFQLERGPANTEGAAGATERFRTAPAERRAIRFVAGGDLYHRRDPMDRMNRRAGTEDPLFALIGGDLAYTDDKKPERWFDYFDSWADNARTPDGRLLPKIIAIGNHESSSQGGGPGKAREFFAIFGFPDGDKAYHAVDFGDWLSFVILDSGHSAAVEDQTDWLGDTLAARSAVPHLFVCYHRPAWGVGAKADSDSIKKKWCPLFERHRVTAVFENDHHQFVRSHPIRDGKIDDKDGIPYLGAGAWSVGVRKVDPKELERRPWIAAARAVNHLYVVETSDDGFTAIAKEADGSVIDRYARDWKR